MITTQNKCVYCHEMGSKTARAFHLDAITAKPQGGFALPLHEYSDEVMRAFLYDQDNVAAAIGMRPNSLQEHEVDEFYAWVRALR